MSGKLGRAATLGLCLAVAALEGYDIQAFGVAAPHMMKELGLGPEQQGWIGSAAMLGLVVGAFFGGYAADRLGRRVVLALSIAVFGLFSVATAVSSDPTMLFVVRFLAGAGFGGAMPNLIAIAADLSSEKRRAMSVTMMFCGLPAGAAIVALFARSMGEATDWRLIFLIGGVVPLALTPLVLWLVPNAAGRAPEEPRGPLRDLLGSGRAAQTGLIWLTFAVTLLVVYLMLNWLPSLAVSKGLSVRDGAAAAMIFNLASIAGALALAPLVDRVGFRWPLCGAYVALAAVMAAMAFGDAPGAVLTLSALAGFLVVGPQCALYALIPSIYPAHARVLGAGAAVAMGRFGSIVGPLVAGELRAGGVSADQVFLLLAPLPLLAAGAILMLGAHQARERGLARPEARQGSHI